MTPGMRALAAALTTALFVLVADGILGAESAERLADELGVGRSVSWRSDFSRDLVALSAPARLAGASYSVTQRALSDAALPENPNDAARFVFSLCVRVDRALRQGVAPGEVFLLARQTAHTRRFENRYRETVQERLQNRIGRMGSEISGDLSRRPGPQQGQGMGLGSLGPGPQGDASGRGGPGSGAGTPGGGRGRPGG